MADSLLQSQAHMASAVSAIVSASAEPGCTAWEEVNPHQTVEEIVGEDFPVWLMYVIAITGMIIGLFEVFFGYRYWRATIFLMSSYIVGACVYSLVWSLKDTDFLKGKDVRLYAYIFGGVFGLIAGAVFAKFPKFAAFVVGAGLGVLIAFFLQPLCLAYIWDEHPTVVMYILTVVLGGLGGILVYVMERPIVIISTSWVGAFLFISSLSALVGGMPVIGDSTADLVKEGIGCIPDYVIAYSLGMFGLAVVGTIIQVFVTAKGIDHARTPSRSEKKKLPEEQGLIVNETAVRYV